MDRTKIAILGSLGYVGKAFTNFFQDHYDVVGYDPALGEKCPSKEEVNKCAMAVVAVPTLMQEDGSCNVSIVEEVIGWLETPLIMIKSTVPPRTTKRLKEETGKRIVFSPEYIGEGNYTTPFWKYPHPTDVKWHDFMVIGGDRKDTNEVIEICQRILGPNCRYFQTDPTTAELVKYMENSWGAQKVTFVNEFYEIAEAFGVDYRELRELFLLDGRTERMHTSVFKYNRGYGGKCYTKDVSAIIEASKKAGYEPKLLEEVVETNKKFRAKNEKK